MTGSEVPAGAGVEAVAAVIADIEALAEGEAILDDDRAAQELARAMIAESEWLDRLRAQGAASEVGIGLRCGIEVRGCIARVARDAVLVRGIGGGIGDGIGDGRMWWVPAWGIDSVAGLGVQVRPALTWSDRLGFAAGLRDWAERRLPVLVLTGSAGAPWRGTLDRVGRDHLDLDVDPGIDAGSGCTAATGRRRCLVLAGIDAVGTASWLDG